MISVRVFKTKSNIIYGFSVTNHGSDIVCAAVSILVQNTVNSIETFTDEHFECEYDESGGYIKFEVPALKNGVLLRDVTLLLNSLELGLTGIREEYRDEITIIYKEAKHA